MPPVSTAFAKNVVRRALMQIADPAPDPSQQRLIWQHFASRCAYCGQSISKELKEGHIDHLVSASLGGRNHIGNRVLSCATCNEKEKRDAPWEGFLRSKCNDEATFAERRARIAEWCQAHTASEPDANASVRQLADACAAKVNAFFDEQVTIVRAAKRAVEPPVETFEPPSDALGAGNPPRVRYRFTRLCFKSDLIEPLGPDDEFRIDTPAASFQMSKRDFYRVFANVAASSSYRDAGIYHYTKVPAKALPFQVSSRKLSNDR